MFWKHFGGMLSGPGEFELPMCKAIFSYIFEKFLLYFDSFECTNVGFCLGISILVEVPLEENSFANISDMTVLILLPTFGILS